MEYMIVHRGDEIHRLCFELYDSAYFLTTNTGIFSPVYGWSADKVMNWLDDRGFKYYWESDHD